jgi:hypothetical protein
MIETLASTPQLESGSVHLSAILRRRPAGCAMNNPAMRPSFSSRLKWSVDYQRPSEICILASLVEDCLADCAARLRQRVRLRGARPYARLANGWIDPASPRQSLSGAVVPRAWRRVLPGMLLLAATNSGG